MFKAVVSQDTRDRIFWHYRSPFLLVGLYLNEAWLHSRYVFWLPINAPQRVQVRLAMYSHVVEKGLAMPEPRKFYGQGVVRQLIKDLKSASQSSDVPSSIINVSYQVLRRYVDFHKDAEGSAKDIAFINDVDSFLQVCKIDLLDGVEGGEKVINREELLQQARGDFKSITLARRSIRNFSDQPISIATIEKAIKLAQQAPSACNLQPTHVYYMKDKAGIQKVLELQTGARGFLEVVDTLFIITADISVSTGPRSRNQGFVDNGLFAMNLMHALLYYEVGSCPMHWAVLGRTEHAIRKVVDIPRNHRISMILVAGHLPESFRAPVSQRVPTEMILHKV